MHRRFGFAPWATLGALGAVAAPAVASTSDPNQSPDRYLTSRGVQRLSKDATYFLEMSAASQRKMLTSMGFTIPAEFGKSSAAADFVLGQYLERLGDSRGLSMMVNSGLGGGRFWQDWMVSREDLTSQPTSQELEGIALAFGSRDPAFNIGYYRSSLAASVLTLALDDPGKNAFSQVYIDGSGSPRIAVWGSNEAALRSIVDTARIELIREAAVKALPVPTQRLRDVQFQVAERLRKSAAFSRVSTSMDLFAGKVDVIPPDLDVAQELVHVVGEMNRDGTVRLADPESGFPATTYGGTANNDCTWAFAGVRLGTKSLLTAEHCSNDQFLTAYATGQQSLNIDAQVNNLWPQDQDNRIVTGATTTAITSTSTWLSMFTGQVTCHQGRSTGYSCGVINDFFYQPWWVPSAIQFVKAGSVTSQCLGGDSGGPTHNTSVAQGILSGCAGDGVQPENFVFGAIDFATAALTFTVQTK